MKIILNCILILFLSINIFADDTIPLSDGRTVLLKEDGTYEFVERKEQVNIILTSITDSKEAYGSGDLIVLTFRVENHGYGSLYNFVAGISALDDRGKEYDSYAFSNLSTSEYNANIIPVGGFENYDVEFKGTKEFLSSIKIDSLKSKYFNMRMLPEDVNIYDMINVESEVEGISFTYK